MSKGLLRVSQFAIDVTTLALALLLAFLIRFDGVPPAAMTGRLLLTGPYLVLVEYLVLVAFGVHRFSWRYISLRETMRILASVAASSGLLLLARLVVGELQYSIGYLKHSVVPMGVLATNFVLACAAIIGVRVVRRILGEQKERQQRTRRTRDEMVRTLLAGAGQAGVLVARELVNRPDLGMRAVGFLDDDPSKVGTVIHGVPVLGLTSELAAISSRCGAQQVLITMASAPGAAVRRIRRLGDDAGIRTKIIPGVYEIVGGTVNLSRIRDVAIEDLLRRDAVELDVSGIRADVTAKAVMVTGAGGSIGSELCRQIAGYNPSALLLVERAENALFNIHRELIASFPTLTIIPCVADVTDRDRMQELFVAHRPELVLHAAAHKHVPMMEWNPQEAVKNNVFGTALVAELASQHSVAAFVMISTDKAVNPTSVMGATKRAAEVYVQALAKQSSTRFVMVRFGNVLGSAGSVVPIFREQIAAGGPVTVTHPEMRRFFMTIPEACQLVLQAGTMGEGGEIFILDMGQPVRVVDLARDLIALSGLREGEDIEIAFTGTRPGEKLVEELATDAECADKTKHPKIYVSRIEPQELAHVARQLEQLRDGVRLRDNATVMQALRAIVPEYDASKVAPSLPAPRPAAESNGDTQVPSLEQGLLAH